MKSKTPLSGARGAAGRTSAYTRKTARKPQRAGRPTLDELERRKAKVMQVATELFVQHGYAATSLVDIAKAAGVATRTLYQHFGDKEAIFIEVLTARETGGAVFPHPSFAGDVSLFDAMMQVARYICDVSLRPRSVDLMRLVVAESRRFPDFMMSLCDKTFAHFRAQVAEMLDELAASKVAPAMDSAKSASLYVDLILGTTPLLVYSGWAASRPTDAELEVKVELFILGRFGPSVAKRAHSATGKGSKTAKAAPAPPAEAEPAAPRRRAKAKAA